jgi:hypothetical protein
LLGLIPYLSTRSSDPGTKGFFSIPFFDDPAAADSPVQNVAYSDASAPPPASGPSGNPATELESHGADDATLPDSSKGDLTPESPKPNLLSRFSDAINPVSAAQAAEGEGPPTSPAVARALAGALHDSTAAAELLRTRDALANYHNATQDLRDYAGNVPNSRVLGKLLELSGTERPKDMRPTISLPASTTGLISGGRYFKSSESISMIQPTGYFFLPATRS